MTVLNATRKALKTATFKVVAGRASLASCMQATLSIKVPSDWHSDGSEVFAIIEFQANDYSVPDPYAYNPESRKEEGVKALAQPSRLHFTGIGPWYAGHMTARVGIFSSHGSTYEMPERLICLADLIEKASQKFNLRHKYPECEMSRVIEALESLGATFREHETQVDRMDRYDWNVARRERAESAA